MAIQTIEVSNTDTIVYTSVGLTAITLLSLCNIGTLPSSVTINIVKSGDTVLPNNTFIKNLEILIDDTYIAYQGGEKIILEDGDSIHVIASEPNSISTITSYMVL